MHITVKKERVLGKKRQLILDDELLEAVNVLIGSLTKKHSISYDHILQMLRDKQDIIAIPIELFRERKLGILEILCKYLKEHHKLKFVEISKLLNRDQRSIWVSYHKAITKKKDRFSVKKSDYLIPIEIFSDRSRGLLQVLVRYLRKEYSMRYHDIAVLLNRDERVIWTVHNR